MGNSKEGTVWMMPAGKLASASTKLWHELGENGARVIERLDDDKDRNFRRRVAEFMLRGGLDGSIHHKLARALLGKNFFGVEEWSTLYGINFSKKQLREVAEFPWGEDVLNSPCPFVSGERVKDTHFAFLGLDKLNGSPLTILKLQELHPETGQPKFNSYAPSAWYSNEKFAKEVTPKLRWYLMPQSIVSNTTDRDYATQKGKLPAEYEVPFGIEEVAKSLLFYRKNGVYLNPKVYGRVECVTSLGFRVSVGGFDGGGLDVDGWGVDANCAFGLAASRKFPSRTLNT